MSVGDSGGVRSFGGGGSSSGGLAIGDAVTDATNNGVLFVDGSGELAQAAGFTYTSFLDVPVDIYGEYSSSGGVVTVGAFNLSNGALSTAQLQAGAQDGTIFTAYAEQGGELAVQFAGGLAHAGAALGIKTDGVVCLSVGGIDIAANNAFTADGTTFEVVDVLKINNTVSATGPGAATHKMTINVGGTDYYIALTAV